MPKLTTSYPFISDPPSLASLLRQLSLMYQTVSAAFNNPDFGATAKRPTATPTFALSVGQTYFDTSLGIPIWWNGTAWVNSSGTHV